MSNLRMRLEILDQSIEALREARRHLTYFEPEQAYTDAKDALRNLLKAFPHIGPDEHRCEHHSCQCCYCHHCHPMPPSPNFVSKKFLARASAGIAAGGSLILFASSFVDDDGNPVLAFPSQFEFYSLYINGMIQLNSVVSVSSSLIVIPGGDALNKDDPILIEFVVLMGCPTCEKGGGKNGCKYC